MNWPLYAFIAILAVGAILFYLGMRGRRINDHPVCRKCRFDLHGVLPAGVTCPECGAALKGPRSTRIGVRVRRRWAVALGAGMLSVAALAVGAFVWLMMAGPTMNKYKPVVILALEGRFAGPKPSREAAKEMVRRLKANQLKDWEIEWGVEAALATQGSLSRPWVDDWGEFVEDARGQGSVNDEDFLAYLRQGVILDCQTRPGVARGDRLPLVVGVAEWRRSKQPTVDLGVWVDAIRVDGRPVEWIHHGERRLAVPNSESPLRVASTAKLVWAPTKKPVGADTLGLEIDLPADLAAGEHVVEVDVRVSGQAGAKAESQFDPSSVSSATLRRTIRVGEGDSPTEDMAREAELRGFLAGSKVEISVDTWGGEDKQPACRAVVIVPRSGAPAPFAFDVVVRIGDREYHAGWVHTGSMPRRGRLGLAPKSAVIDPETEVLLIAEIPTSEIPDEDLGFCDVIFRPRPDLVPFTMDMTGCFGEEIIVERVGVTRQLATQPELRRK